MSTLWTPSGEHAPEPERAPDAATGTAASGTPGAPTHDEAAAAEELRRVRAELLATPVADIVANHALGLWQLAVLHLTPEGDDDPDLDQASTAIDAMAGIVESLGDRLGANADALREALAQLRLAYVQLRDRGAAPT